MPQLERSMLYDLSVEEYNKEKIKIKAIGGKAEGKDRAVVIRGVCHYVDNKEQFKPGCWFRKQNSLMFDIPVWEEIISLAEWLEVIQGYGRDQYVCFRAHIPEAKLHTKKYTFASTKNTVVTLPLGTYKSFL